MTEILPPDSVWIGSAASLNLLDVLCGSSTCAGPWQLWISLSLQRSHSMCNKGEIKWANIPTRRSFYFRQVPALDQRSIHEAIFDLLQDEAENIEVRLSVSKDAAWVKITEYIIIKYRQTDLLRCPFFFLFSPQVTSVHGALLLRTGKVTFSH